MSQIVRFGVSLEEELLERFDRLIRARNYANRSEAIRDLIREALVAREWEQGREVVGAISLVYDHQRRELVNKLMNVQHEFHSSILSTQHVHLEEDNCLEIVVVKGRPEEARRLFHRLRAPKGVKHAGFTMSTNGKELD